MKATVLFNLFTILLAPIAWAQEALAAPGTYTAQQIRTAAVNSSGKRHDTESLECIAAPQGQLFEQSSFRTRVVHHKDDDERRCTPSFRDYVEYAPGILEPRTACLYSFVKSVGGIASIGKRGHLQCGMDYQTHEDLDEVRARSTRSNDAKAVVVALPADLSLDRNSRSLITVSVPLRTLQFSIDQAIRQKQDMNLPAGFDLHIMSSGFRSYGIGSLQLHYYVDLDISGPVGARCEVDVRFAIPAARPNAVLVQDIGTTANCRSGSQLGNWFNLSQKLSDAIRGAITQSLGKKLLGDNSSLDDWAKDDPELAAIVQKAIIQGRYCNWRGEPGLCLAVAWRQASTIVGWEGALLGRVPASEGPIDRMGAETKLQAFAAEAVANHQAVANGVKFPTGTWADGTVEDGDMAIFGGLLCRSGAQEGCQLLRDANTADGRFWRSPRRKNEADTKDHASFSGDQLKGVLHYVATTGDRNRLVNFLHYLRGIRTQVPDPSVVLETGYSSCPNFGPNFTCLLSGTDWYVLRLLAQRHGVESALPADLGAIEGRYGFSYDVLVWEALMTNSGYRLHLVANTAWILRSVGETDARLDTVFALLAARQPDNPFFLYLLLGADKRVQRVVDAKCTFPITHKEFSDWAWQRAEGNRAWERSMVWDCVFMYGLLTRDPMPVKP